MSTPRTIVLIACSGSKLDAAAPARELYTGQLFRASVRYAESQGLDWYVLSAKHHVVHPDTVVEPYDLTLGKLRQRDEIAARCKERELETQWRLHVRADLFCGEAPILRSGDRVIMLAGKRYREAGQLLEHIVDCGVEVVVPLEGLGIGHQKSWLKRHTIDAAAETASAFVEPCDAVDNDCDEGAPVSHVCDDENRPCTCGPTATTATRAPTTTATTATRAPRATPPGRQLDLFRPELRLGDRVAA